MEEDHGEGSPTFILHKSPQLAPGSALKHTFHRVMLISRLASMHF